jgi:TRAP-type transport system periplasmic protein
MPVVRRRNSLHRVQAAIAGFGVLLALVPAATAQEVTLKAAVFVPPSTTYGIPFKRFVDHINETGKGILQIRIVGGPEAVPADGQAQAVKSGVLDIASIPPTYYKSAMVEGDAQILSDMSVAEQRKSGAYAMLNQIAVERMNSLYLTTYGMGVPFHLYVSKEMPLSKPDDLKGLRFRGQPNYNAIFKNYGIAGVNIAAPEVYTALDPGCYNVVVNILMNKTKYDSLTAAQRKVIDDAVAWFEADSVRYTNETTKAALDLQEKQGIKVVNFGPEFKKIAVDLYWDDLKKLSPESIGKIQALLTK